MKYTIRRAANAPAKSKRLSNGQRQAEQIAEHLRSPTLMLLVLIAVVGAILYGIFLFNPNNRGDLLPYVMVIIAETFIIGQGLLSLWTILSSSYNPRNFEFHNSQDNLFTERTKSGITKNLQSSRNTLVNLPMLLHEEKITIDVFITVYGEPLEYIQATAEAARYMIGKHQTYILDDGKSDEVEALARQLGVGYIRRDGNDGAKAGNINHALARTNADYFVVFDADFVPDQMFLYETMPFFEDGRVAFVQTPQHYDNDTNLIAKGASYMQRVFYSLIQPGKNRFNAAFCVGTNVVFQRRAIDTIGGIYDKSKSEDIWTSLKLHEAGYESVYIPNVLAIGRTPDTIESYSKQQLRWATGGFEIFLRHNPLFRKKLSIDQKVQYFGTASYYFGGIASLMLLLLPPLQIFFNLSPVNLQISFWQWAVYYSSFYVIQIFVAFYTMGGFKLETLVLANASAPIYLKALWNAIIRRDQAWLATNRSKESTYISPFNFIFPQLYILLFLIITSGVGIWKIAYTREVSVSVFWNTVNAVVFASFFLIARREAKAMKKQLKRVKTTSGLEAQTV